MKLLYIDCETGGLDAKENPLLQISGIVDISTINTLTEFDFRLRPHPTAIIDAKALSINGLKAEELHDPDRLEPVDAYKKLKSIFLTYIDRYDRKDKFYLVGQNVHFDYSFLLELWKRQGDDYLGSFIHYHKIDLIAVTAALKLAGRLSTGPLPNALPDMKLSSLCEYFRLPVQTHDAMNDIRATREIFGRYIQMLRLPSTVDLKAKGDATQVP